MKELTLLVNTWASAEHVKKWTGSVALQSPSPCGVQLDINVFALATLKECLGVFGVCFLTLEHTSYPIKVIITKEGVLLVLRVTVDRHTSSFFAGFIPLLFLLILAP